MKKFAERVMDLAAFTALLSPLASAGTAVPFPHAATTCVADPLIMKVLSCGSGSAVDPGAVTSALSTTEVIVMDREDWYSLAHALWGNDGSLTPAVTISGDVRSGLSTRGVHQLACYYQYQEGLTGGTKSDGPTLTRKAAAALKKADPEIFAPMGAAKTVIYVNGNGPASSLHDKYIAHEGVHSVLMSLAGSPTPGSDHVILAALGWMGKGGDAQRFVGTPNGCSAVPPNPGVSEQARHGAGLPTSQEATAICAGFAGGGAQGNPTDGQVVEPIWVSTCTVVSVNGASSGNSIDATKSADTIPTAKVTGDGTSVKGMEFIEQNNTTPNPGAAAVEQVEDSAASENNPD